VKGEVFLSGELVLRNVGRDISTDIFFTGWGCQPHAQPSTWRTRVSLSVWVITFDLSGMEGPTSS